MYQERSETDYGDDGRQVDDSFAQERYPSQQYASGSDAYEDVDYATANAECAPTANSITAASNADALDAEEALQALLFMRRASTDSAPAERRDIRATTAVSSASAARGLTPGFATPPYQRPRQVDARLLSPDADMRTPHGSSRRRLDSVGTVDPYTSAYSSYQGYGEEYSAGYEDQPQSAADALSAALGLGPGPRLGGAPEQQHESAYAYSDMQSRATDARGSYGPKRTAQPSAKALASGAAASAAAAPGNRKRSRSTSFAGSDGIATPTPPLKKHKGKDSPTSARPRSDSGVISVLSSSSDGSSSSGSASPPGAAGKGKGAGRHGKGSAGLTLALGPTSPLSSASSVGSLSPTASSSSSASPSASSASDAPPRPAHTCSGNSWRPGMSRYLGVTRGTGMNSHYWLATGSCPPNAQYARGQKFGSHFLKRSAAEAYLVQQYTRLGVDVRRKVRPGWTGEERARQLELAEGFDVDSGHKINDTGSSSGQVTATAAAATPKSSNSSAGSADATATDKPKGRQQAAQAQAQRTH
jgi:hypothetical protein